MTETEKAVKSISPPSKIKVEPESDNEFEVACRLCTKTFASCTALMNHAKISHVSAYSTGNPTMWTLDDAEKVVVSKPKAKPKPRKYNETINLESIQKTHQAATTMKSTVMQSLASTNVSYIIIKSEEPPKEKKIRKIKKSEPGRKSPLSIMRPLECVEASPFGADGVCHQMFITCCEYTEHQVLEHAGPRARRRAPRCLVCERVLMHTRQDKPHPCEQCVEAFDTEPELTEHKQRVHVKKKKFECSLCRKRFSAQGGLVQHMRMHTGDRPYACAHCPKAFTQKSGLEQHTRTHTKERPYRCVLCRKAFVQTVHLRQHMRTHTNLTPFQCVVCGKRFKQSNHLNYHYKHHPNTLTKEQHQKYMKVIGTMYKNTPKQQDAQSVQGGEQSEQGDEQSVQDAQSVQEGAEESPQSGYSEIAEEMEIKVEQGDFEDGIQVEGTYDVDDTYTFCVDNMDGITCQYEN